MSYTKPQQPLTAEQQKSYDELCAKLDVPRKPRKIKSKPVPTRHNLKARYYQARRIMFEREYPAAWNAGGYYDNAFPKIDTTNGTQNYIQDVLNNLGHMCERVNVMGVMVKGQYRRSGSTVGSSDLHCVLIGGRSWKIEIKKGADSLTGSQAKYQQRTLSVGALHSVVYVGNLDWFWDEFDEYCKL